MDPELLDRLRADLDEADFRLATVSGLLGEAAEGARLRGVFAPARRALSGRPRSAPAALIRLFLLGEPATAAALDEALPTLGARGAERLGLVTPVAGEGAEPGGESGRDAGAGKADAAARRYVPALSLNPVETRDPRGRGPLEWWILSDLDDQLRRGPARPDHVMGVGGATRSLLSQSPPDGVDDALDVGTGCGVVAMHLALHARRVVATDVSERALWFARANARLNGLSGIEFRLGDLFAPVADEHFDLILTNPPFVITPRGESGVPVYEYRDAGMTGDELAAAVVREGPRRLREHGTLLCLANWESPWGRPGLERVRGWLEAAEGGPFAAWVVERERLDPARYAETWARDGGARPGEPEFERLMDAWLQDFSARRITAIGLGSIRVRRLAGPALDGGAEREARATDRGEPGAAPMHLEHASGAFADGPLGGWLADAFDAGVEAGLMGDAEVLATRWVSGDSVTEEREHTPGEEAPRAIVLSTDRPIARRVAADPLLAAAVGASDGELTLAQIADALATLLEVDAEASREALVSGARELAWCGMLRPASSRPRTSRPTGAR